MSDKSPLRATLRWQLWLDGEVQRAITTLADGLIVVLDPIEKDLGPDASPAEKARATSRVRRLDDEGRLVWETTIPGIVSGDPARTEGLLALPVDGERVVVLEVRTGNVSGAWIQVVGASIRGSIAALGGRIWVRFAMSNVEMQDLGPYLAVYDPINGDVPRLFPDPLGDAIESRYRRTNRTLVAAGELPDGNALLVGLDEASARELWRHQLPNTGVADLWAAGGLVDLVMTDAVQSFDARTGMPLTRRFVGLPLDLARIAGEILLVPLLAPSTLGAPPAPAAADAPGDPSASGARRLLAFDTSTEEQRGELHGLTRLVGADSNLALLTFARAGREWPVLVDMPRLTPYEMPESDAMAAPRLVAFARHGVWVVAHDGRSLSALEFREAGPPIEPAFEAT